MISLEFLSDGDLVTYGIYRVVDFGVKKEKTRIGYINWFMGDMRLFATDGESFSLDELTHIVEIMNKIVANDYQKLFDVSRTCAKISL